ncbi:MAG TPA: hypothetical protein VGP28_11730 [Methylocella sp.]|jgi:hypothetical protein|nr:hypothetical protein [Methylocella sp.]
MFQLFDFACFLFHQTFTATIAPQSAPDCNCEFSLTPRKSKKLEKRAMLGAGQWSRHASLGGIASGTLTTQDMIIL